MTLMTSGNGNGNSVGRWLRTWFPLITWVLAILLSVGTAYATIATRLAVLEASASARENRLERIENKLDRLIEAQLGR